MKRPIVGIQAGQVHCAHVEYKDLIETTEKSSYVVVTDWHNGEGFDLQLDRPGVPTVRLELTHDDWTAIKAAADAVNAKKKIFRLK